jgi:hypothetical protein
MAGPGEAAVSAASADRPLSPALQASCGIAANRRWGPIAASRTATIAPLFNDLVGAGEQRKRDGQPERLPSVNGWSPLARLPKVRSVGRSQIYSAAWTGNVRPVGVRPNARNTPRRKSSSER